VHDGLPDGVVGGAYTPEGTRCEFKQPTQELCSLIFADSELGLKAQYALCNVKLEK